MTKFKWLIAIFLLCGTMISHAQKTVKIACVGNSITYGSGLNNQHRDGYPGILGQMLGAGYEVRNYGYGGRTLLNKGDRPYMKETMYQDALAFCPDIVTIKLGTNDTKPFNWKYKEDFSKDLESMVRDFQALPSHPMIYLCYPVPAYRSDWGINDSIIKTDVQMFIDEVAVKTGVQILDLYTPFSNKPEWFVDKIHPNEEGALELAKIFYQLVTGKEVSADFQPQAYPGVKSSWEGYDRYDFNYKERKAVLVTPKEAASGRPWIWRSSSFTSDATMDKALLEKGFHVVYYDVTDTAPLSKDTLKAGDYLYKYLSKFYQLSPKVVMEGCGQGSVYACRWAEAYPHKVAALYLDTPVLEDYQLDTMVARQIPIYMVGDTKSKSIPYKNNGKILAKKYASLGGNVEVVFKKNGALLPKDLAKLLDFISQK